MLTRWQQIRENEANKMAEENRKTDFEERRPLEDKNMREKVIV